MTKKITQTRIKRIGGGSTAEDMWYDEEEYTVTEGEKCPECGKGKMIISCKGNLYCSEICWKK